MDWFQRQFTAIAASIDFTPVEEKLDEVNDNVADVKTAVEKQQLTPTAEINGSNVLFHFVTLAQMEKMHISITAGFIGFTLTKGEDDFELRFSADSPQEIAGQLVLDDSIDMVNDVFESVLVELPSSYEVRGVYIDGVDANLLESDINWRLADIQKRIGEGGEDPNSKAVAEFFGVTLLQGYEFMTDTEVTDELEDIMQALDPELLQEVEYPEGSGIYMTKAQAITAQAMNIINPSQS
jgi:hypothetical protein